MYKLEIAPKVTKELLLSKNPQEMYFEHYLGVPIKKGLFRSPSIIRSDTKPTCSFYKNKNGILMYKDFAGPSFDFIGCVMFLFHCNYYNALRIIANDFNIIPIQNVPKNPPKITEYTHKILEKTSKANIAVEIKNFTQKELDWWKGFGISYSTLKKFNVFSIKSIFLNGNYFNSSSDTVPMFGYYGGTIDGEELWRIYMPTKRTYRFLSNWSQDMIQGAKQMPCSGEFIIITKSMKDVMSLYEFGIPAIAPNTENLFLTKEQYKSLTLSFKDIYLLYDRDLPGVKAANKIRKKFPNINVILMPKTKDFTDYVKRYGESKTIKLIEEWLKQRKKN